MKMNDIKFTPKANAFADVYGKATGVPFIGEMMAAAAGNGGESPEPEPEPEPEQFAFTSVKVIKIGEGDYTVEATSNIPAPIANPYVYMTDDPTLGGCEGDYTMAFTVQIIPTVEDTTKWVLNENSDYHSFVDSEIEDGCGYVYRATAPWIDNTVETDDDTYQNTITGTWTFEDQTI